MEVIDPLPLIEKNLGPPRHVSSYRIVTLIKNLTTLNHENVTTVDQLRSKAFINLHPTYLQWPGPTDESNMSTHVATT